MTKPKSRPKGHKKKLKSASPHEAPHPVFSTPWAPLATRLLVPKAGYPQKPTAITLWRRAEPGVRDAIQEEVKRRADLAAAEEQSVHQQADLDPSENAVADKNVNLKGSNGMGKEVKADSRRKNLALQESIAQEMFAQLKPLEQAAWKEAAEEEYKEAVEKWEEEGKVKAGVEERQKYIETLPEFLDWYSMNISQDAGRAVSFIAGGPDPSEIGKLNVVGVRQGHLPNDPQANFGVVHREEYENDILKDYGSYLRERYTQSMPNEPCLPASPSSFHTMTTTSLKLNSEPSALASSDSGSVAGEYRVIFASPQVQTETEAQARPASPTQPRALHSAVKPAMNVTVDTVDMEPTQEDEDDEMGEDDMGVGEEQTGMAGIVIEHEHEDKGEGKKYELSLARTYRVNYPELEGLLKTWNFDLPPEFGSGEVKAGPIPSLGSTSSTGAGSSDSGPVAGSSSSSPPAALSFPSTTSPTTPAAPNTDSRFGVNMDALMDLDIESKMDADVAAAAGADADMDISMNLDVDLDLDLEEEVPNPSFQASFSPGESSHPGFVPVSAPVGGHGQLGVSVDVHAAAAETGAMEVDVSSSSEANPPDPRRVNRSPDQDCASARARHQSPSEPHPEIAPSDASSFGSASPDMDASNSTPNGIALHHGHGQTQSQTKGVHLDSSSSSSSKSNSNPDGGGQREGMTGDPPGSQPPPKPEVQIPSQAQSDSRAPSAPAPALAPASEPSPSRVAAVAPPASNGSGAPASVSTASVVVAPLNPAAASADTDAMDVDVAHPDPEANSDASQSVEGIMGPSSSQLPSSVESSSTDGPDLSRPVGSATTVAGSVCINDAPVGVDKRQDQGQTMSFSSASSAAASVPGLSSGSRAGGQAAEVGASSAELQPVLSSAKSVLAASVVPTSTPTPAQGQTQHQAEAKTKDKELQNSGPGASEKQITLEDYDLSNITENDLDDDYDYEAEADRFYNGDDDYEDDYEDDVHDEDDENGYPGGDGNPIKNMFRKFLDSIHEMSDMLNHLNKATPLLAAGRTVASSTKRSSPPPVASSSKVTLDSSLSSSSKSTSHASTAKASSSKSGLRTPYSEPLDVDSAIGIRFKPPSLRVIELPTADDSCNKVMIDWDDDFYGQVGKGKASAGSGLGLYSTMDVPELYITRPTPSPPRVRSYGAHSCERCAPQASSPSPLAGPIPTREQSPLRDVVDPIFRLARPRPLLFIGQDISDKDRLKVPPKAYTRKHRDAMANYQRELEKEKAKAKKKEQRDKKEEREREKANKGLSMEKNGGAADKQKNANGAARQGEQTRTHVQSQVQAAVPARPVSVAYPNEASKVENIGDLIDRASAHVRSVTANVNGNTNLEVQVEPPRDAPLTVNGKPALAREPTASKAKPTVPAANLPDRAMTNGSHAAPKVSSATTGAAFLSPPALAGLAPKAALEQTSTPALDIPETTSTAGQKMLQVEKQGPSLGALIQKLHDEGEEFYQDDIPADPDAFAKLLRKPDSCMDVDDVHDLGEEHNGLQEAVSPARRSKRKRGSEVVSAPHRLAISGDETPASRKSKRLRTAGSLPESVSISPASSTSSKSSKRRQSSAAATTSPRVSHKIPSVPAADASAPQYFKNAIQMFTSSDQASFGPRWTSLISLWSSFEANERFTEVRGLGKTDRPQVIADWIARARSATWRPNVAAGDPELKRFEGHFRKWWTSLQPQWRVVDEGKGELVREMRDEGREFDELRLPGKNGIVSVLAALFYWGIAVKDKSPKARARQKWLEAVEDCHWVFEQLVGPSH